VNVTRAKPVFLGLGCNIAGNWGECDEAFDVGMERLRANGVEVVARSANYTSPALGLGMQPDFLNCVIEVTTDLAALQLLKTFKKLERSAGRKIGPRWGVRPLDIDILDYRGQVLGWRTDGQTRKDGALIFPHPEMHMRAFVLKPLGDIAPNWCHPVLKESSIQLLARLDPEAQTVTKRI